MNRPSAQSVVPERTGVLFPALTICFAFGVCLLAVSRQSLWIDEALSAVKAMQPTLGGWWAVMVGDKASDLQMPLYMLYLWAFEKVFSSGEWALRAANIPWFIAGVTAFVMALPRQGFCRILALAALGLSPFAWYYLDEARPYAMQLGGSLMVAGALMVWTRESSAEMPNRRWWILCFTTGWVVLCGSSLLGMIWAGSALVWLVWSRPSGRLLELWRTAPVVLLVTAGVTVLIGVYYLWTLQAGARASAAAASDWKSTLFVGYELLGFGGVGPGRLDLRQHGLAALGEHAVSLSLYGVAVAVILAAGTLRAARQAGLKRLLCLALVLALPAGFILATGFIAHFRVLGRHFTPVLPVVLFLAALGLEELWARRRFVPRIAAAGFVMAVLVSCLSFRFASRHQKDDYRSAAAMAADAIRHGQTVWWNAAKEGASYYGLPVRGDGDIAGVWWVMNPMEGELGSMPEPGLIVGSKPDVYDSHGVLNRHTAAGRYVVKAHFPAFTVWEAAGDETGRKRTN